MAPDAAKAAKYLRELDDARCEGNWAAVPELVRKVRKHAPTRETITLVAETEATISEATQNHASSNRPTTLTAKDLGVTNLLPKLLARVENEHEYPEDRFQARVCVGWLHWVASEYGLAAHRLPATLEEEYAQLDPVDKLSEWTNVCALKAAYLRANCYAQEERRVDALRVFESGLPSIARIWSDQPPRKQLRYWSELFLTEYCMLSSLALSEHEKSLSDANSLAPFRSWARFWERLSGPAAGGHGFRGSVPRRRIWSEYYTALSRIIEDDLPFPTGYIGKIVAGTSARSQLRMELKRVELAYETLLLNETTFPRAEEERGEVEDFVRLLMKNWTILCGRGWRVADLGQGGRESCSRGVLEVLYRAATKTYHSTSILRNLFVVHLSVSEFDLAFKTFDSYLEIVKKAKARVDQTGDPERHLDGDGLVLETMSQCIIALCRYGDRQAAERARDLASELEDWLARLPQLQSHASDLGSLSLADIQEESAMHPKIPPPTLALSWQAIGLAHAAWSRVTFDAQSRTEIQAKAIRCLRRSLSNELGRSRDTRGLFALGLLFAERRELSPAIDVVKLALMSAKPQPPERTSLVLGPYAQERSLVSLWHLLALLLTARQEFGMAARACEGAFEQFKDPVVLFGDGELAYRSEHLNEAERRSDDSRRGVVDEMDDMEKEAMLEVKMTQLAIIEVVEGPDVAVNASNELVSLFTRLFGSVEVKPALNVPKVAEMPKSSAGTLRSMKGSIFGGRSAKSVATSRQTSLAENEKGIPSRPHTTQTTISRAPTIQITPENTLGAQDSRQSRKSSSETRRSVSTRRTSLRKRESSMSRSRAASSDPAIRRPATTDGQSFYAPGGEPSAEVFAFANRRQTHIASSFSRGRAVPQLDPLASSRSRSNELADASIDAVHTVSHPLPIIHFSKEEERRQRTALLVRVWLVIAGFYRRAGMHDDCKAAVTEAQKLVQGLDADLARDGAGSLAIKNPAWAVRRSVEELWGDVWSELGQLSLARGQPYSARADFESALTHYPNHPGAIVGLSNILLDIYTEELKPPPAVPQLDTTGNIAGPTTTSPNTQAKNKTDKTTKLPLLPSKPLGLGGTGSQPFPPRQKGDIGKARGFPFAERDESSESDEEDVDEPVPPHKASSLPLNDRLAARDRAYGLLSGLTKLGSGWNDAEAWLALARAYEESGQADKAKEALWWCVELEESMGVRDWNSLGPSRFVL